MRWAALGVLVSALFIIGLDLTILSVALPTLAQALAATTTELQWMVDSYAVAIAAALLPAGMLADRLGRKRMLLAGLVLFGLMSGAAGFSRSAGELIAARAGMGLAAAVVLPLGVSILPTIFPPEERRRALAAGSVAMGLGTPLGPLLAGYLLEHYHWGSVFLINVPIVVVTAAAGLLFVPESRAGPSGVDVAGIVLSSAGLASLVYGIIQAPREGWGDPVIVGCMAAGLLLLAAFAIWERRAVRPLVDFGLFANARFTWGTASATMVSFALFGTGFVVPQYLQLVSATTPLETGVRFLPLVCAMVVSSGASDPLTARFGTKVAIGSGLVSSAAGFGALSLVTPASGYGFVAFALVLIGLGLGLALTPALEAVMGALPESRLGVGSAVVSTIRQVGGALSVAVLGSILATVYALELAPATSGLAPADARSAGDSIAGALLVADRLGGAPGALLVASADSAFTHAAAVVFGLSCALTAVAAAGVLAFMPSRSEPVPHRAVAAGVRE